MTDVERLLWQALRDKQLNGNRFRRQHPIGKFIADFACIEQKVVIELDGGQHQDRVTRDELRTSFLRKNEWQVLRFWNNDVMGNLDGVLSVIAEALENSTPTLTLPLQGGGHLNPSPLKGEGWDGGKIPAHSKYNDNFRQTIIAPILIFAIGNESRGDDALAPLLLRQLQAEGNATQADLIEDYQLQVEHVTDLLGRKAVLFVDADMSCDAPFRFSRITAAHDHSYTSHAMTPFALLHAYRQVYGTEAPDSFLLRIRGYGFELGADVSDAASANLEYAVVQARAWLADIPPAG